MLITSNNVFANVDDVKSWIENIKLILDPKGYYVLESFYLLDFLKNKVFDFIYHEHLSALSVSSINYLCKIYNLKLVRVEHVNTKGGSMRYYIRHLNNEFKVHKSVNEFIKKEKENKIFSKKKYYDYFREIYDEKKKLIRFFKAKGINKFDGFGASITCVTLMYQFKIEKLFSYLFDDNRFKHGMFSPGSHIEIVNPNKIKNSNNDTILILAWRFQKNIIQKHQNKLKKYKHIIQVMPKFKILKL